MSAADADVLAALMLAIARQLANATGAEPVSHDAPPGTRPLTLRDRILAAATAEPHKQSWFARRIEHRYDSYFRQQFGRLVAAGLVVRDSAGGWRRA